MPKHLCAQACACACVCVCLGAPKWRHACLGGRPGLEVCVHSVSAYGVWGEVEASLSARHSPASSNPPQFCKVLVPPLQMRTLEHRQG